MFDAIFKSTASGTLSFGSSILAIFSAFALGLIISFTYIKTHKEGQYAKNFTLTLVMIPAIIAIIILLVGSNIARAFSLAGAFSIIRFRSAPGDPKDIAYVFFSLAAGLACGVGSLEYAFLFTIILCLFMVILSKVNYGDRKSSPKLLKITVPEDLNYRGAFDDVFKDFTLSYSLRKVKTTDLGTLFELIYEVYMRDDDNEKDFLDALRCRNGNLSIILALNADTPDYK